MRAVILAAGLGSRLRGEASSVAKPLVPLGGRPLIAHTLDGLAVSGVDEVVVVTGHRSAEVMDVVRVWTELPVTFVPNPYYQREASLSLRAAQGRCADEPFLLLMSDHAFAPELVERMVAAAGSGEVAEACFVAADRGEHPADYVDEATKLLAGPTGQVTAIGKRIRDWTALDAGAFTCSPAVWDAAAAVPEDCTLSTIFGEVARRGLLRAADVTGCFWYDVDTEADLARAEQLLAGSRFAPAEPLTALTPAEPRRP